MRKFDITYGVRAKIYPRDYSAVANALLFLRKNVLPVRVTTDDGQVFTMHIQGVRPTRNKLDLCPFAFDKENRVRIPFERISTIESNVTSEEINADFTGRICLELQNPNFSPSRRDFFLICRKAYEHGHALRIFMRDGREITGKSVGVDGTCLTLRHNERARIIVLFDSVMRILPYKA